MTQKEQRAALPFVGLRFYDATSGVHVITSIDARYHVFMHTYTNDKGKKVEGFMYDVAFVRLLNADAITIIQH